MRLVISNDNLGPLLILDNKTFQFLYDHFGFIIKYSQRYWHLKPSLCDRLDFFFCFQLQVSCLRSGSSNRIPSYFLWFNLRGFSVLVRAYQHKSSFKGTKYIIHYIKSLKMTPWVMSSIPEILICHLNEVSLSQE